MLRATVRDKRGRVLAIAHNNYAKTHPIQAHFASISGEPERQYLHAEIAALLRCKYKNAYSIHIERYKRDGSPALAAPCKTCQAAIKARNIQKVTYTGVT